MPSTYSTSLGLELIGNGEQAGVWGTTTNNNLGTLLEAAIAGVEPITLTGGDYTLTDYNGLPDQARSAVLVFGGLLGAPCNVIAPSVEKIYVVRNFSNATVTVKTSSGNGVALTNAASAIVFCDGTNFYSATTLNFIDGNLTVTGTTTLGGVLTCNSSVVLKGDVYGNVNTGQWILPTGTSSQRLANGVAGTLRYNSEIGFYEGYSAGYWVRFLTVNQGTYSARYLVISGGAGGADAPENGSGGGGGGAGGVLTGTFVANPGSVYTFVVGAGGGSNVNGSVSSLNGSGGSGISVAPIGGGTGGSTSGIGSSGGSGGGSGARTSTPGSGTGSQGNAGGNGNFDGAGGGGGWGGVGGTATGGGGSPVGGPGGVGATSDITGTAVYYAGGGGGIVNGIGGTGGGGTSFDATGGNGTVNTGGGGAGGRSVGGSGGSGVCILSVPTIYYSGLYTGTPVITASGGNTILKYNTSGTYTA